MTAGAPPTLDADRRREAVVGAAGVGVLALLLVSGLAWAKWLPYVDKGRSLADGRTWPGGTVLDAAGATPSLAGAWAFTVAYFDAVWQALLVALVVAAAVDALVPRRWLLRVTARRTLPGQALVGAAMAVPGMMCTCCTAPVAVGLRRRGAPLAATLAYWVGNPLLNPAVLVFLLLVLPWQYAAVRLVAGGVLVVGATALVAAVLDRRGAPAAATAPTDESGPGRLADLPGRYLRSLGRFSAVLVPEYVAVVFLLGLVTGPLAEWGLERELGVLAALLAAVVGVALVVPTGGEIPVVAAVTAAGAGAGLGGVLLIALPAVSLPSVVMVGRAVGWRATGATAGAVLIGSVGAGALLATLS